MHITVPKELRHTEVLHRLRAFCDTNGVSTANVVAEALAAYVERVVSVEAVEPDGRPEVDVRIMRTCAYCGAGIGVKSQSDYAELLRRESSTCPACHHHPGETHPIRHAAFSYPEALLPLQPCWSYAVRLSPRLLDQVFSPVGDEEWQRYLARENLNAIQYKVRAELAARRTLGARPDLDFLLGAPTTRLPIGEKEADLEDDPKQRTEPHTGTQHPQPTAVPAPSSLGEVPSKARPPPVRRARRERTKPRLRCECTPQGWRLLLEFPVDIGDVRVRQDSAEIHGDGSGQFVIRSVCDELAVQYEDRVEEAVIQLDDCPFLVFRHRANWEGTGTRTRTPSCGHFTALVPVGWERDVECSGPPPITPEASSYPGYAIHFFRLDRSPGMEIAFRDDAGQLVKAESLRLSIRLFGTCVPGDPEELGPVFLGKLPRLALEGELGWQDVETIEIESISESGTMLRVQPDQAVHEQPIRASFAVPVCGEFAVRLLDADDSELCTTEFRYAQGLRAIAIESDLLPPDDGGHMPTLVRFEAETGTTVRHLGEDSRIKVEHVDGFQTVRIPPDSICDQTTWEVEGIGRPVAFRLTVLRLWWRVCEAGGCDEEWQAIPLPGKLSEFKATSEIELHLRMPAEHCVQGLSIGFEAERAEPVRSRSAGSTVRIPLRRFCDDAALNAAEGPPRLTLFVRRSDSTGEAVLIEISAKLRCKICGEVLEHERVSQHICSHAEQLLTPLTYDEIRMYEGIDLPEAILCCSYCGHYVTMEAGQRAASRMMRHIEEGCEKARPEAGPVQVSFRVVTDAEEVRSTVIRDLPRLGRCAVCGMVFASDDTRAIEEHLRQSHQSDLVEVA